MNLQQPIAVWLALWRRYLTIFRYYWQQRHQQPPSNFFNQQEAEFLPAALAIQATPDSSSLRWTARILMSLVGCVLLWAILGRIDIIVNANGKIIPSNRTKTIASVDVASVKALYVSEGQSVHAGEVLIELDSSSSDAEHDKAAETVAQATLQIARARAMIHAIDKHQSPKLATVENATNRTQWQAAALQLQGQYQDFYAKKVRLESEINRYAGLLPLAMQRAEDFKALQVDNTVSRHAWLEKEQARLDLQGQLNDARNQLASLIAQTRKDAYDALNEGNKIIAAARQDQRRAGEHSKLLKLTAPVDGTVQQLQVHTVGGVVPAAQPLMQIVPADHSIEVEAFLENKDVGFVQEGQKAEVKIDAFEYTRYGTLSAKVRHVSHDAIPDQQRGLLYAAQVLLDRNNILIDDHLQPLAVGMSVNVEIKTGNRRMIEYILSPVLQHAHEALRER